MRWEDQRRSDNVEDRRGAPVARRAVGGGLGVLLLVLAALYFGVDPSVLLQGLPETEVAPPSAPAPAPPADDPLRDFVAVVLASTEDVWSELFRRSGRPYPRPVLVLFSGAVESACGLAESAVGPFYCPADRKLYIDLAFYRDLKERFRAPGDFAQAYVIAHEVGHHVQTVLGISERVRARQERAGRAGANALSVRMELQADCLAGVWAHHADRAQKLLEAGDVEEALNAAAAIGDDRLQRASRGSVTPDSFTHGSSAQRVRWFRHGLQMGEADHCDTFAAAQP